MIKHYIVEESIISVTSHKLLEKRFEITHQKLSLKLMVNKRLRCQKGEYVIFKKNEIIIIIK